MFIVRNCSAKLQMFWLFFYVITLFLSSVCCYDPCPEHLRQSESARPVNIPQSEIEKAFQKAEKIVESTLEQEERLVREGKVVNRKVRSAESSHQQAFVKPEVRERELRQRTFQEASAILIKKYGLSAEEVHCSLPKADLSSPSAASAVQSCVKPEHVRCDRWYKYRTADGTCNNLENPTWGSAFSCVNRLLPAVYSDNGKFRRSVNGRALPEPRALSLNVLYDQDRPSHEYSHMFMFFGQFVDHDMTLTPASTTVENEAIQCCPIDRNNHQECAPISITHNDPFYSRFNVTCLNFVRSAMCTTCKTGPRIQMNQITSFIDASLVYGNSESEMKDLRDPRISGNLRTQQTIYGDLPPPSNNPPCSIPDQNVTCFQTGDPRGNQHPVLASIHTLFVREHNCIASVLREMNQKWDKEKIFQEARKIVGAKMQVITYKEYVPATIGAERMDYYDMWTNENTHTHKWHTEYDEKTNPGMYTEFSTAAFRFGHSMIDSLMAKYPKTEEQGGPFLKNEFFNTSRLYSGEMDLLMRGSTMSPSQDFDRHFVPDVTNFLYRSRGNPTGFDLPAFNIQRGRDHGLQPYVELVRYCTEGKKTIKSFEDLKSLMSHRNVDVLRRMYNNVNDIDLFVGIVSEKPLQDAAVGPTAACIIGLQFKKLQNGDRFFCTHHGVFSRDQWRELRKVSLAKLMCKNAKIDKIQENVMLLPSDRNPVRRCSDLPEMDLRAWKEK